MVRKEYDVVLAAGQESLSGKIFRIGHMGRTAPKEIQGVLDALSAVLPKVGFVPPRRAI